MWSQAVIKRLILPMMFAIGVAGAIEFAIDLHYRPELLAEDFMADARSLQRGIVRSS